MPPTGYSTDGFLGWLFFFGFGWVLLLFCFDSSSRWKEGYKYTVNERKRIAAVW